MNILILHHPYDRPRFEHDFMHTLGRHPAFTVVPADLGALAEGRLAGKDGPVTPAGHDAVIVFVAFPALRKAPPIDWQGYSGLRVLYEHDAIQNYSDIHKTEWLGAWPPVFRHHRFDLLLTTGGAVQRRLARDGIPAAWLPKGFEPARFMDLPGPRAGIAAYGSAYTCRVIAERAIAEAGLPFERIPFTPYAGLAPLLSRHLACLAITADLRVPFRLRGMLDQVSPAWVPMTPGLEPMAKLFEAAGAGCCPVADDMEDLKALGFVDGETAITFRNYREMVEKLRWWTARPDQMRALGSAAAALARERHGWGQRAVELEALIGSLLRAGTRA